MYVEICRSELDEYSTGGGPKSRTTFRTNQNQACVRQFFHNISDNLPSS